MVDERKKTPKVRSNIEPNCAGIVMQKKTVQPPAKTFFFWRSCAFSQKKLLNLRFRPAEKAFEIRRRPFFGDHMFLAGENPGICDFGQKKRLNLGEDLFFWRSNKIGSSFQKSLSLCKILATPLIFIKVLSMLQKRPSMQNFTI